MKTNSRFSTFLLYTLLSLSPCFASNKIEELNESQINFHDKWIPESCYLLNTLKDTRENFITLSNFIGETEQFSYLKSLEDEKLNIFCITGILEALLRITDPKYKKENKINFQVTLWLMSSNIKFNTDENYKQFIFGYNEKKHQNKNNAFPFNEKIIEYTVSKYSFVLHYTHNIFETYLNNYFHKESCNKSDIITNILETYYNLLRNLKNFYLFDGTSPDISNNKKGDVVEIATFKVLNELEIFMTDIFSNDKEVNKNENLKNLPACASKLFENEFYAITPAIKQLTI